jgi:hypothetical protein
MDEKEYLKSLHKCVICGEIVGCVEDGTNLLCSLEAFRNHVAVCREKSRGKTGRVGPDRDED